MIEILKRKGREKNCPSCSQKLKFSWLSGMSSHNSFMYSEAGDAILVDGNDQEKKTMNFSPSYPLLCPNCKFELVTRSNDPTREQAIFLDGMTYITKGKKYKVEIEVL